MKLIPGGIGELDVGGSVNFSRNRRNFILNRRFQIVQKPETIFEVEDLVYTRSERKLKFIILCSLNDVSH